MTRQKGSRHFDRDRTEVAVTEWWNRTARHGMTASEAGRTLIDALDAAGLKIVGK